VLGTASESFSTLKSLFFLYLLYLEVATSFQPFLNFLLASLVLTRIFTCAYFGGGALPFSACIETAIPRLNSVLLHSDRPIHLNP